MVEQESQSQTEVGPQTIDRPTLTPLVCHALDRESVDIIDWDHSQIHGGAGDQGRGLVGLYRFAGHCRDQNEVIPWSLILKIVNSSSDAEEPAHPLYWKREVLAYQSGLLANLPGGIVAPRCFAVTESASPERFAATS